MATFSTVQGTSCGGTTATIDQFVIVGTDGEAQLALSGGSKLQADNAYVNVGEIGPDVIC